MSQEKAPVLQSHYQTWLQVRPFLNYICLKKFDKMMVIFSGWLLSEMISNFQGVLRVPEKQALTNLGPLCWFQTNLPLAALPIRRVIIACCFRVAALSGNAALAFHRAAIAPELNRIQLSAICCGGQSGKVIDLLAWRCLPLGHPSAASDDCAVELISLSKRQCGKRQVSLKPALCDRLSEKGNFAFPTFLWLLGLF